MLGRQVDNSVLLGSNVQQGADSATKVEQVKLVLPKLSRYNCVEVFTMAKADVKKTLAKFEGAVKDLEEVMRSEGQSMTIHGTLVPAVGGTFERKRHNSGLILFHAVCTE